MSDPSEVSAVVLTLGEATTEAALASLRAQTLPPRETIVIRDVHPFHQAINAGARQVSTPFFVQVDADMILDPDCLAQLLGQAGRRAGIVVGHLRDALIGRVVGVKLFRTAPFLEVMMGDTISPDTDLGNALRRAGWATVYAGRLSRGDGDDWRTYGEHRPDYRPEYTWRKYLLEGRRYRYRKNPEGIRWHFGRLEASQHPSAVIAQVAMANGFFLPSERDLLGRLEADPQFARLADFLALPGSAGLEEGGGPERSAPLRATFDRYLRRGRKFSQSGSPGRFRQVLGTLTGCHKSDTALVATVGLCRGLFPEEASHGDPADFEVLEAFLAAQPALVPGGGIRGLAAHLRRWLRQRMRGTR